MRRRLIIFGIVSGAVLGIGSWRNPNFWRTPEKKGDALLRAGKSAEAATVYSDPWHIGVAQYRDGAFEAAARTFARVPGAPGAFNQGNAWLMHGKYDAAIASYDRALGFHPGWQEAADNKAVAIARKAKLEASGEHREEEATDAYKPDEIVFDQKGENKRGQPTELAQQGAASEEELRATWLRKVKTTPADFLRAKFAYQAIEANRAPSNPKKEEQR
jgi:Ca-activated chloride channel family protein